MKRSCLTALLATGVLLWSPVVSLGDLNRDLSVRQQTAAELRAAIRAETRRISATSAGVGEATARLADLQAEVNRHQAALARVQGRIVSARRRLEYLENRMHDSARALSANLVASYKDVEPDVISVVLASDGFTDMLERLHFLEQIRKQDQRILRASREARVDVIQTTQRLQKLQERNRALTNSVIRSRNQAAALQGALLERQAEQLRARANSAARLGRVRGQIASIQKQIRRLSRPVVTGFSNDLPVDAGGMAQAPANAPSGVKQVIAAGNAIAGLPYVWGGGHGSFRANGYDCSGSISYALAAAGLLSSPLDSTGFMSWGEAGPGKWITVYANPGHAFMVVAGWRFDTSALRGGGTRWTRSMRGTGGFVARHPAGL